jgi:hypothetical protein
MRNSEYTKFIQFIFTPEDTCSEFSKKSENSQFAGQIKTMFWIMISIAVSALISITL